MPAELGGAERPPGDAVARLVEAAERPLEAAHPRQPVRFWHEHPLHHYLAGDGGAQGELALDLGGREPGHPLLQHEAGDLAIQLGPHHEQIGDGGVGDPHLVAGEQITAVDPLGAALHGTRVGTRVRLGEAEAAHQLAPGQSRQPALALGLVAIGVDRMHHQDDCTLMAER